jgi:hypothetical protein
MPKLLAATVLALTTGLAVAHGGHGFTGPHWHVNDLFAPAVMLVCATAAFWLWRKKQ